MIFQALFSFILGLLNLVWSIIQFIISTILNIGITLLVIIGFVLILLAIIIF